MKNAIAYYYNLYSYDIHQIKDIYKFTVNGDYYVLTPCNMTEINSIYELSLELQQNGIYVHQIIPNNSKDITTIINNVPYVLLQLYDAMDKKVGLDDILYFNNLTSMISFDKLNHQGWDELWGAKIDYFEYQINQFGKKYPILRESFSYYVGLTETGISLYVNSRVEKNDTSVSHRRIKQNSTTYDLYNPLNLIMDYKVRDACEYFKNLFLTKDDILNDIINYFQFNYLSTYECFIFFIRMFYPSFYFDLYEEIMSETLEEEKIEIVIKRTNLYELVLKKLYKFLSGYMNLPDIEWLK